MEDVLFHANFRHIDHSKFMDTDFVYKAFMSWHGLVVAIVVVAAVVVCFVCLFSDQQCQAVVICPDYHGGLGKQSLKNIYAIWTFFMSMQALQCNLFKQKFNSLTMVEWLCKCAIAQQSDYTSISVITHFNNTTDTQVVLHQWVSFGTGGCVEEV